MKDFSFPAHISRECSHFLFQLKMQFWDVYFVLFFFLLLLLIWIEIYRVSLCSKEPSDTLALCLCVSLIIPLSSGSKKFITLYWSVSKKAALNSSYSAKGEKKSKLPPVLRPRSVSTYFFVCFHSRSQAKASVSVFFLPRWCELVDRRWKLCSLWVWRMLQHWKTLLVSQSGCSTALSPWV